MTRPAGPSASVRLPAIAQPGQAIDLRLVEVLDRIEAAIHVAIERGVADRHFRLVAGGDHHQAELVGDRHQDDAARARLQIFFGDVARRPAKNAGERRLEPLHRAFDRHHVVVHAERLRDRLGVVERFLRGVAVGQHHAAHALGAERIDRERRAQARNRRRRTGRARRRESGSCRHSRAGRACRRCSRPDPVPPAAPSGPWRNASRPPCATNASSTPFPRTPAAERRASGRH